MHCQLLSSALFPACSCEWCWADDTCSPVSPHIDLVGFTEHDCKHLWQMGTAAGGTRGRRGGGTPRPLSKWCKNTSRFTSASAQKYKYSQNTIGKGVLVQTGLARNTYRVCWVVGWVDIISSRCMMYEKATLTTLNKHQTPSNQAIQGLNFRLRQGRIHAAQAECAAVGVQVCAALHSGAWHHK